MKNKFTRKDLNMVSFDFTGLKKNKIKRTTKEVWAFVGCLIFGIGLVAWFYIMYLIAFACM